MNNRSKYQLVNLLSGSYLAVHLMGASIAFAAPERDLLSDATATSGSAAATALTTSDAEEEAKLLKALESPAAAPIKGKRDKHVQIEDKKGSKKGISEPATRSSNATPDNELGLVAVSTEASAANELVKTNELLDEKTARSAVTFNQSDSDDETSRGAKTGGGELEVSDAKLSEMEQSIAKQMAALKSQAADSATLPSTTSIAFEERINDVNSALLNELMASEPGSGNATEVAAAGPLAANIGSAAVTTAGKTTAKSDQVQKTAFKDESSAMLSVSSSSAAAAGHSSLMKGLERVESDNRKLVSQLVDTRTRAKATEQKLKDAQARLILAETEVERLSKLLEGRGGALRVSTSPRDLNTTRDAKNDSAVLHDRGATLPVLSPAPRGELAPRQAAPVSLARFDSVRSDMPIATVTVDKANLRAGPSMKDGVLMSVSKGARLVVERRQGDWLQVLTPANTRAYVAGDMVVFSNGNPDSAVRVRASKESSGTNGNANEGDSFKLADR